MQLYISFFIGYYELKMSCIENSVDPDQMVSSETKWSGSKWFSTEFIIGFKLFLKGSTEWGISGVSLCIICFW